MPKFKPGDILVIREAREADESHMMRVIEVNDEFYIVKWFNSVGTVDYNHDVIDRNLVLFKGLDPNFAFHLKKKKE